MGFNRLFTDDFSIYTILLISFPSKIIFLLLRKAALIQERLFAVQKFAVCTRRLTIDGLLGVRRGWLRFTA